MILKNVGALLEGKRYITVASNFAVTTASESMAITDERAALVVDDGRLLGIVSEKDIVQKCVAKGLDPKVTDVSVVMTTDPVTIDFNDTVGNAIDKMLAGNFHHLPVLNGSEIAGMVYSDDIPEEYRLLLEHFKELKG